MEIPSYDVVLEIGRHGQYTLYRGRRTADQLPVLLKTPRRVPPRPADSDELQHEFELLSRLSVSGIPRAYDLIRGGDTMCLVLEDRGLAPLSSMLSSGRLSLTSFFKIAISLCTILDELHRRQITHGGIQTASVMVGTDLGNVQLLNVGLASRPTAETGALGSVGAVAYLSPEQTGRTNRAVDYRTDFYSLGVSLYELLTGAPPFNSDDPLEVIHAHIAKAPTSPAQADVHVPEQLSRLVMKLLAKSAEDRYQSALGIAHDLEHCQREWASTHAIALFELGQQDVSDHFLISQRLYGRDRELGDLQKAFEDACDGRTTLMLVAGYSGIGKTSLIHHLYKPIVRQRGYFIAGKFDQVVRNIPYGAFTQALRSLVWQLLTESEDRLSAWRARLSHALGANGGVLAEVIPEIELILGKQPLPPPLDPTEARNRFGYVFRSFVGTLAQKEHPLVVFLDDLQWVDAATLDLLHALITSPDSRHLLLIGAYRDNEVDAGHLLTWATDRLEASGARVRRLSLGPLALPDLTLFLCDTLHGKPDYVEPLARLIQQKTDGNPFFLIQFLKTLEQEGLLTFDRERTGWSFTIDAIAGARMTDNVVDLMTRKIQRLSPEAQDVLTLAACIGNPFDWDTLVTVSRRVPEQVSAGLSEAVDAGLIHPAGDPSNTSDERAPDRKTYSFLHDRVQQAAYGLIPEARKKPVHLDVGRLLRADVDVEVPDDRIFAVLNHLNIGWDLITSATERLALARLNFAAGQKAKTSAAYRAAVEYFEKGIALLDVTCWGSDYELMFSLHLEAAECEYLAGGFERAAERFRLLLERAATPLDRAQVHSLRITLHENQSRWAEAVASGHDGLGLFGISFPEHTADKQAALDGEVDAVQRLLGERAIASLIDLPEMTDANMRMVMRILTILWAPAYISGDQVLARLISATMVRLSLAHGNTEDSAYGYVTHAITIGPIRRDYRAAYAWGELALQVNKRFNDLKRRAKIHQQFQAHVNLWCRPFETCIPHAREASRSGLEAGDFVYAGYGAATEAWSAWLVNRDLDRFVRDYSPTLALLEKIGMTDFFAAHRIVLHWALALQGRTSGRVSLSDSTFDEQAFVAAYEGTAPFFLTFVYVAKLHLHVMYGEVSKALAAAERARDVAVTGTIWPVLIDFWGGLAATAACRATSEAERQTYWEQLLRTQESLRQLADTCPENFRCFSLLLSAEMDRADSKHDRAAKLSEEATVYARQTDNLQMEALANELRARGCLEREQHTLASAFMSEAYRCYEAWGATAKLAHLEQRYGHLLAVKRSGLMTEVVSVSPIAGAEEPASVDMATVLKVAHAIAVEIEVSGLLRKLMKLALENAGAQRGTFLQEREGGLVVEARATADPEHVSVGQLVPLDHAEGFALSVVRYVHRTGQDVVVGDATSDERFAGDA